MFESGQKCEARFGGKNKYYGGTIVKSNGDGTYEIKYDDGDTEKRVVAALIRSSGGGSGGGGGGADAGSTKPTLGAPRGDMLSRLNAAANSVDDRVPDGSQTAALAKDAAEMASPNPASAFAAAAAALAADDDVADEGSLQSQPNPAEAVPPRGDASINSPLAAAAAAVAEGDGELVGVSPEESNRAAEEIQSLSAENEKLTSERQQQEETIEGLRGELRVLEDRYKRSIDEITRERALLAERRRVDPSRDPKLKKALDSLVLLREAPTTWDRLRASVFHKCKCTDATRFYFCGTTRACLPPTHVPLLLSVLIHRCD